MVDLGTRPAKPHVSLETTEPMLFGYGFISGLLSAILGIAGFGAVLCLHFPQYLTHAQLRPFYSLEYLRAIIHVTLVASFLLGSVSAFLRANKALALIGIGFTLAAALLGGSRVPLEGEVPTGSWLGLDFWPGRHAGRPGALAHPAPLPVSKTSSLRGTVVTSPESARRRGCAG